MNAEKKLENDQKRSSNISILIVSFLLLVSIAMTVFGFLSGKSGDSDANRDDSRKTRVNVERESEDESLSDMFQKEFSENLKDENGYDLNDPFRETCAPVDGSQPVTTSFTVCQPH